MKLYLFLLAAVASAATYHQISAISIPGAGGWDYVTADSDNRRLYVSHGNVVEVLDLDTNKVIGQIPDTNGVHGIAIAQDLGRGFISAGRDNQVVIFDLKTLAKISTAKTGTNPDGILYEPTTQRVFTFNGRSKDATAINAKDGTVLGTIDVGGKPEFPVADGKGNVFVNVEDKNEILHIDPRDLKVKAHWPISAASPSGLAIDTEHHRLFSVCDGEKMVVLNYDTGQVVTAVPIGGGPDAVSYDPGIETVFSSNGEDGTVTVVKVEGKDHYVPSTVKTKKGARTMTVDLKTHRLYLPSADYEPKAAGATGWPKIKPDSFKVLVLSSN